MNIAKGIVAQEVLKRRLEATGVTTEVERKSHRDADLFDFRVPIMSARSRLDVKSFNYYSDYAELGREPLTPDLILENADYSGPVWSRFFPMLVPHTQVDQDKQAYCFAFAKSTDFRKDLFSNRVAHELTAFPYGEHMPFMCSSRLCMAREEEQKGFWLAVRYEKNGSLFSREQTTLRIVGEWENEIKTEEITLVAGKTLGGIGPFSVVCSFQISAEDFDRLDGRFELSVASNDLTTPILNTLRRDINESPSDPLILTSDDFCNLILPSNYELLYVGWILKEEFMAVVGDYAGWVWPNDSVNRDENQPWSVITEKDKMHLERAGFKDAIKDNLVDAGWMKTHGKGGGACCYVFPNIGYNGGVKENNLYVLPKDLYIMDDMVDQVE